MITPLRYEWVSDSQNPQLQIGIRIHLFAAATAVLASIVLYAVDFLTRNQALYIAGFFGVVAPLSWFLFRGMYRGVAEVETHRLVVKTAAGRSGYPWQDTASFEIRERSTGVSARLLSILRIADVPFIEVRLKKHVRAGLFGGFGTDRIGIPTFLKRLELRVRDVNGLAEHLSRYVPSDTI